MDKIKISNHKNKDINMKNKKYYIKKENKRHPDLLNKIESSTELNPDDFE